MVRQPLEGADSASGIGNTIRDNFLSVVQNSDLGAPLETDILSEAKKALAAW